MQTDLIYTSPGLPQGFNILQNYSKNSQSRFTDFIQIPRVLPAVLCVCLVLCKCIICVDSCHLHHSKDTELFHQKDPSHTSLISTVTFLFSPPSPQRTATTHPISVAIILSLQECYLNRIV